MKMVHYYLVQLYLKNQLNNRVIVNIINILIIMDMMEDVDLGIKKHY